MQSENTPNPAAFQSSVRAVQRLLHALFAVSAAASALSVSLLRISLCPLVPVEQSRASVRRVSSRLQLRLLRRNAVSAERITTDDEKSMREKDQNRGINKYNTIFKEAKRQAGRYSAIPVGKKEGRETHTRTKREREKERKRERERADKHTISRCSCACCSCICVSFTAS